jgi:hypothetical protein
MTELKCPACANGQLRAYYISNEEFIVMCRPSPKKVVDRSRSTNRINQNEDVSNLISLASSNPAVLSNTSTQGELTPPLSTFGHYHEAKQPTNFASLRQQTHNHQEADEDF